MSDDKRTRIERLPLAGLDFADWGPSQSEPYARADLLADLLEEGLTEDEIQALIRRLRQKPKNDWFIG